MTPDQELIAGIGQGDRKAFAELYRRYQDRLYHYALGLMRSPEPAEDALHDVFVALVRQASRGTIPGNVSAYLYAAVRHRCFDMLSRRAEIPAESVDPDLLAAPPGDMERIEQRQAINLMLAALPDDQREAVLLRIFHQMDFREIAGLQGVPVNTALSRYHYALKRLRKEFAGDEDERKRRRAPARWLPDDRGAAAAGTAGPGLGRRLAAGGPSGPGRRRSRFDPAGPGRIRVPQSGGR